MLLQGTKHQRLQNEPKSGNEIGDNTMNMSESKQNKFNRKNKYKNTSPTGVFIPRSVIESQRVNGIGVRNSRFAKIVEEEEHGLANSTFILKQNPEFFFRFRQPMLRSEMNKYQYNSKIYLYKH
jgi:hypothetical protein